MTAHPEPAGAAPAARTRDRAVEAVAMRRREIERDLAGLVTPELVEEHRRRPAGRHSPHLAALLAYFRQQPTAGKLVVHAPRPGATGPAPFRLLRLSGRPGQPHEPLAGAHFAAEDEALHAAFLHRLAEHAMAPSDPTGEGEGPEDADVG